MRFFFVFMLVLAAVHLPVYLLAKSIFRKAGNPQRRRHYAITFTIVSFTISLAILVYLFLVKPGMDNKVALEVSECKGYTGNISAGDLTGKWQVPWGFITIDANRKVTEKYIFDGRQNTGTVSLESNILTYLYEDASQGTIRNVYRICDYSGRTLQVRFIFTSRTDTVANNKNMEWTKVRE